ncbi:hypothetical protein D3C85_1135230 [compost metagenome]
MFSIDLISSKVKNTFVAFGRGKFSLSSSKLVSTPLLLESIQIVLISAKSL